MTLWITFYEAGDIRHQQRRECLRSERGLAITSHGPGTFVITHLATGKRLTGPLTEADALGLFPKILLIADDWTLERPAASRADWQRLGLVLAQ